MTETVLARELITLDRASQRILDQEPVRTNAWEGLEGRLVLPAGGTLSTVSVHEPDSVPRAVPMDATVELLEDASGGAQETWRELWEGRL